ncbi:MAG: L-threonylcarbamoyladenylate synthase [Patescibacteria group bacterium]
MILVLSQEIQRAIMHLQAGGVVVYPTESSYGVGCMATNAAAVARVFTLKERPIEKTLPLIVGSIDEAKRLIVWSSIVEQLAQEHWPGPLTIVALATNEGKKLAPGVVAADGTIALRVSSHPIAQALAQAVGPIVSTSANSSSEPACYASMCVKAWLGDADVLVIDAGTLPQNPPSTIVRIYDDRYAVVRQGGVAPRL